MRKLFLLAALFLSACATAPQRGESFNSLAEEFVKLTLVLGEREAGYVDAYYGPPEWQAQAKLDRRPLPELGNAVTDLTTRVSALRPTDPLLRRRQSFMLGQLRAAETRIRMMGGEKLSFDDEAEGLFGVRPQLRPLSSFEPTLARIERLVPGPGPLSQRVQAYQDRFIVPRDKLDAVMRAAIAECRRRTAAHIDLPAGETFTLEFVTGKSWSGYNYYKGGYRSLIQVNTDLPVRIDRAIDLGCHEGYPGHHAYNLLLERDLARARGWTEFQVNPLYSPQSIISEGSANYGIELAFSPQERLAYTRDTLFPLAGLPKAEAAKYLSLLGELSALSGARMTIARDYLNGRITKEQAIDLSQRYSLVSRARAEQSLSFNDQYRSYVINYGLGLDMVRAHIERGGVDQATRWARMKELLSTPTLPSDLER